VSRILLVRHGQASFGAADYDNLSPVGEQQSEVLGRALAARGITPDLLVVGEMKRHVQTADGVRLGLGLDVEVTTDAGWNEFDHLQVLAVHTPPEEEGHRDDKAAFQAWFEAATLRWTSGAHDDDYDESFATFTGRVRSSLTALVDRLPASGTAVVLTSGGPVAWAAASLLADDAATRTDLWLRLNPVSVNTGVSTVVVGSRGTTLVTWNSHDHLPPNLITYR
jgi:broad specificity phosphatase PhoE